MSEDELGCGCAIFVVEPVDPYFVFPGIFDPNVVGGRCRVGSILIAQSMVWLETVALVPRSLELCFNVVKNESLEVDNVPFLR
ncbi:MAG TPA: hypothetical protein DIV46_05580, partial [Verrucomicrobiales bacterium]|nr:hypothetical protein [Verrucomicrobiales bacterium]